METKCKEVFGYSWWMACLMFTSLGPNFQNQSSLPYSAHVQKKHFSDSPVLVLSINLISTNLKT